MNENEIEIQATDNIPEVIVETAVEEQEQPKVRRSSLMAAVRSRAYNSDLTRAHVALMEREVVLPQKQLELFRLVNRHYRILQTWHDQYTGWRIQRGSTVIRLVRHLSTATPGYLYERLKDPKDFACLTWVLWFAENRQLTGRGNDQQFLLSQLAEQVQEQSTHGSNTEKEFDFRKQADRYSIQRALQYLEDLGGIQLVDGQTREWVEQTADADVLYEFTDVIHSLVAALDPQVVEAVSARLQDTTAILQPTLLSSREGMVGMAPTSAATTSLVRAWRALLLGPALFRFDDPAAFAELLAHADAVARDRRVGAGGEREGAVVRHGCAAEARLMSGSVEDIRRERMVALNEENDLAAAGEITFKESAFAFLCETRDRKGNQERADR